METPAWLRSIGTSAWLLVGIGVLAVGLVWVAELTETIVLPLITASVIAAVASPLVSWMKRHRVPRPLGTVILMAVLIAFAALIIFIVIRGVTSETQQLSGHLDSAKDRITGWLSDLGVDPSSAKHAGDEGSSSISSTVGTLLTGVSAGIEKLSSLVFYLALTLLSTIFLLMDGPTIRAWFERHMGLSQAVAHASFQRVLESFRGYFLGVTIVAGFNAVVVGIGAFALGVPLAGTIAIVTFFAAYIPYLGAWTAGAFSVLVALGGAGPDAAAGMLVVQLLANTVLQQLVQPFAMGAALGIHPLAVLVVTIGGGCLFGTAGLVLAAPVTAAIVKISADQSKPRTA